jgi:hypothetical protein
MQLHSHSPAVQNNAAMIPAAAPIASPASILNPTTAAPLLVCAGAAAVVVVEVELPDAVDADAVEAGEVAVPVLVLMLVVELTDVAVLDEDADEDVDEVDTVVRFDELGVI